MVCFEITINGKKRIVAGASEIKAFKAAVSTDSRIDYVHFCVDGFIGTPRDGQHLEWINEQMKTGDRLEIRLIESEAPDLPRSKERIGREAKKGESVAHNDIICSFCGKGSEEVRQLIAGGPWVHICDECIILSKKILDEELDES